MPPPAEGFAARLLVGPALRAQPDRRLIALVRDGYEAAFEEIVRRYGRPLTRYAAAIVGGRAEDVTQDAFSKALLALRRDCREIELRPWLFRIVRNTALNDLRDRPPSAQMLAETIAGGGTPEEELERREELANLMRRLQALPNAQRAAIVMRELEGLSHEEIARALGTSGSGARQAIFRARQALRDGLGMLLPLPLLKSLLAGTAATPVEAAAGAVGVGGGAVGTGVALKAAAASVLVAGAVSAGVAIDNGRQEAQHSGTPAETRQVADDQAPVSSAPLGDAGSGVGSGWGDADDHSGSGGENETGDDHGRHRRGGDDHGKGSSPAPSDDGGGSGSSGGSSGGSGPSVDRVESDGGHGGGGGSSGPGGGGSGSSGPNPGSSSSGPGGSSGSGSDGSGSNSGPGGGGSSDDSQPGGSSPPPSEETVAEPGSGTSGGSGSSGGGSGSNSGPGSGGSGNPSDSRGGDGFSS